MADNARKDTHYIGHLLRPHWPHLTWAFLAALGEAAANLAEPWPIKIVLDNVLQYKPAKGWRTVWLVSELHGGKQGFLALAVGATLLIAIAGAVFSYTEKRLTTGACQ